MDTATETLPALRYPAAKETNMTKKLSLDFDWAPTHRILTSVGGENRTTLVMLRELPGPAYTKAEWDSETAADYEVNDNDEWTFQGHAFEGKVETIK